MSELILDRVTFAGKTPTAESYRDEALSRMYEYFKVNYDRWLPSDKASSVLDFGCGTGSFLLYLRQKGFLNCVGFEPDTRYAKSAAENTQATIVSESEGKNFLATSSHKFDFILCRHVLYYFSKEELPSLLEALKGALKPGGTLLVEVFNTAGLAGGWSPLNDRYIANPFSEHSLGLAIEQAGFRVEFLGAERYLAKGIKRCLWLAARRLWWLTVKVIYVLERGFDSYNPKVLGKNIILVARS